MKLIVNLQVLRDLVTVDEWILFTSDDFKTGVEVLSHFVVGDDGRRLDQTEARKLIGKLKMSEWDKLKIELKTAVEDDSRPKREREQLRLAVKHGLATAPGWVRILDAAAEWHKFPWEIMPSVGQVIWWIRWNVYLDEKIRARE